MSQTLPKEKDTNTLLSGLLGPTHCVIPLVLLLSFMPPAAKGPDIAHSVIFDAIREDQTPSRDGVGLVYDGRVAVLAQILTADRGPNANAERRCNT